MRSLRFSSSSPGILLAFLLCLGLPGLGLSAPASDATPVVVGSKNFTESYILAELIAQTLIADGKQVVRKYGLGGTLICYEALKNGEIDVYVDYTGTISQAILKLQGELSPTQLNEKLQTHNLKALPSLGFNNTYAIALRGALASERRIKSIADLQANADLKFAFSHEFLERADGWHALAKAYGLHFTPVGIEHGLAYQALAQGQIDVTDAYSTDGEIPRYQLALLEDDKAFFPTYLAVPVVRLDNLPELSKSLAGLAGALSATSMQALNARATVEGATFEQIIREWRAGGTTVGSPMPQQEDSMLLSLVSTIWPLMVRHLQLSSIALLIACLLGIPLAVLVHNRPKISNVMLYLAGLLQTIPAIALLALFIPWLGIGVAPAIAALFFYSLLPILRNTVLGLTTVDPTLVWVSRGMGMTAWQRVAHLTFPLALPTILAGVRTAAVISIGTATLAAFIGAGGLGEPIVTGLALNDPELILRGAIPAALLAILTELLFELIEKLLIPAHLRRTNT